MVLCVAEFLEKSKKPLKSFIKKRISNEADAEDILQDVFLKLISNIDKLADKQKINAWMFKITRNAIVDYYRKNRHEVSYEIMPPEPPVIIEEEVSENYEIATCLKNMADKLPEKYRQAICLTVFENYTQKEYSQIIGISVSGAKSRVQRARHLLKKMVLDCCTLEFDALGNIIGYRKRNETCMFC